LSAANPSQPPCERGDGAGLSLASVTCVIVSYWPDVSQLSRLCEVVLGEGAKAIVVDNTESPGIVGGKLPPGCDLVALGNNSGIARAQNVGVAEALKTGAAVVVFFDQDSRIEPGFIARLVAPLKVGVPAITSPCYVSDETGLALPSLRLDRFGLPTPVYRNEAAGIYQVDIVISSGTAATSEVFGVAGGMDEALFIDSVDSEWCLRCRSKGIPIYVVPDALMGHRIGTRSIRFGRFTILQHNPVRCYYQVRNCFHMIRRKHVPFAYAMRHMLSVVFGRILLLFFVKDRYAYVKAYAAGVRDGVKGVTGRKPG
jgi:rhamnosyltransferase